jgi:DNA mismatch endonuclease (patch repair protein)
MQANRRRDTGPELALRKALFAEGLRYRVDHPIRCDEGRPIRPDIVFTRQRLAVFVDGCFWHGCPEHCVMPKANRLFWRRKLERNIERDRETDRRLEAAGWCVVRVWEHESVAAARESVTAALHGLDSSATSSHFA